MPVHVAGERLLAVVDDLHRPIRVQREHRAVHLHRQVFAPAERAADTAEVDAHLFERAARGTARPARGRRAATASRRRCRHRPRRPARRARTPGRGTPGPGCRCRRRPRRVTSAGRLGVTVPDHHVTDDVRPVVLAVAVPTRRLLRVQVGQLGRALHVGDGLERLVLDDDPLGGAPRLLRMIGGDERDRLAVIEDAVDREHRLIRELEAVRLLARDVLVRQHRVHARHRDRLRRCRSRRCVRARVGCAACDPRASPGRSGRSRTRTRPSPSAARRHARRAHPPCRPAACGTRSAS